MRPVHLLLVCFLQSTSLPLLAQGLDITFSGNGKNVATIGARSSGRAMLIQPADQKILVVGYYSDATNTNFAAVRFLPTGNLDTLFGARGKVSLPFGINCTGAVAVALQSDGKIIMLGEYYISDGERTAILVRLTSSGQLDPSFSPTGYIIIPQPIQGNALLVQPDDKILVGGDGAGPLGTFCVARYTKDGIADPTWGSAGVATTTGDEVEAMALQPNGEVVAAGFGIGSVSSFTAVLFTKNGVVDKQFGTQGVTNVTIDGRAVAQCFGVGLQNDGSIILLGRYLPAVTNPKMRFLIVRLRADGSLDPAFAGNGKLGVDFSGSDANAYGVVQLHEGQLVVAGYEYPTNGNDKMAMCRVGVNGAIDYSFGPAGWVTTGWTNVNAVAFSIALQKDGKIVVGGAGGGFAVARYLNPFIIPPPPVVNAVPSSISPLNRTASIAPGSLRIFPNPSNSILQIEGLDASGTVLMTVVNASGGKILTAKVKGQNNYSLDIHRLTPGMYFLELLTNGVRQSLPFLKVN